MSSIFESYNRDIFDVFRIKKTYTPTSGSQSMSFTTAGSQKLILISWQKRDRTQPIESYI
jgi:hypothetical protein